ncbi:MAG: dephospho-CoA kinase [Bacteroidota bacterium]
MKYTPLKIGITGGIGSGKTSVCKIFETLGIPVYYADDRAKQLMSNHEPLIERIKSIFGAASYDATGQLNRPYLAQLVFADPAKLRKLNELVHPAVAKDAEKWHRDQTHAPYTLKEAALLFESGSFRTLDRIICVYAPPEERIRRVMERDQVSEVQVRSRMSKQMSDFEKIQLSDDIITNNGKQALIPQVLSIHRKIVATLQMG